MPFTQLFAKGFLLDDIDLSESGSGRQIRINFTSPITYLSHFPTKKGVSLEIRIKPGGALAGQQLQEEKLDTPERRGFPLRDINVESDTPGEATVVVRFASLVNYTVKPARDGRSISVILTDAIKELKEGPDLTVRPTQGAVINTYTINLKSSLSPFKGKPDDGKEIVSQYKLYTMKVRVKDTIWYRRRMGFFETRQEAERVRKQLEKYYPLAWIDLIGASERPLAEKYFSVHRKMPLKLVEVIPPKAAGEIQDNASGSKASKTPATVASHEPTDVSTEKYTGKTARIMEQARQAMIDGDYRKAVRLYTKILDGPDAAAHQDAQEFLGLARERNGQIAHAKAEYEAYLKQYAGTEGAVRVKQRLAGIITARETKRTASVPEEKVAAAKAEWDYFASVSQFYRRQEISTDSIGSQTVDDSLDSDLLAQARRRGETYDMRMVFAGSNRHEFNNSKDASDSRVSSLYIDTKHRKKDFSFRIGRQTHNSHGVLGRFDGVLAGYRVSNLYKLNFVAGYPVELTSSDGVNTDKEFVGLSLDIGTIANKWDINVYGINQTAYGLTDRQAIGSEVRYVDEQGRTAFGLVDYDTSYGELNTLMFVGTWRFDNGRSVNVVADYRNSPILTTSSAIQGQMVSNLGELQTTLTEEEIRQLAEDRTARFKSLVVSGSTPLNEKFQLNGDITISSVSSTAASGGVPATEGTGTEYALSAQLIGSNWFSDKDTSSVGVRLASLSTSDRITANFSTRFPVSEKWRLNPRLKIEKVSSDNGGDTELYSTLLRADYRWTRRAKLEFEAGYDDISRTGGTGDEKETGYSIRAGYIYDFF